ncbi:Uncharacterized protein dnm_037410 [Desulfonema magnum]|uniref:Uncharacterized protein n=1 Tax=Desulfonema magnum TaxID=45655 RepID=A0A975BM12_9BACT|nr:Uncharacterized protein dnm_037410 [Desulfonema magnum]
MIARLIFYRKIHQIETVLIFGTISRIAENRNLLILPIIR